MKNLDELKQVRDSARKGMALRLGEQRGIIKVAMGDAGLAAGARAIMKELWNALEEAGVGDVAVLPCGACCPPADKAPVVVVEMTGTQTVKYDNVDAALAKKIVAEHILGGATVSMV